MKPLPGYRWDEAKNRYFKLDDQFDKPPAPTPPAPIAMKKPKLVQKHKMMAQRAFRNVASGRIHSPALLSNLQTIINSDNNQRMVCGINKNRLFICTIDDDETNFGDWTSIGVYAAVPQELRSSILVAQEAGYSSLVTTANTRLVHYSPFSNQVLLIKVDNEPQVLCSANLPSTMTCLTANNDKQVVLLGKGIKGMLLQDDWDRPQQIKFPGKPTKSDPLCASFRGQESLLVGLRQGRMAVWDMRDAQQSQKSFAVEGSGPVANVWQHTRIEHLVTCFAPNGDICQPSLHLLDLRFEKPLASFDLHSNMTSPIPMMIKANDASVEEDLIVGYDVRTNQYRVFEMDTAQFVAQMPDTALPTDVYSNTILEYTANIKLDIFFSSRSQGLMRVRTHDKT